VSAPTGAPPAGALREDLLPGATLYECAVRHVRAAPLRNAFTYRTYQWLVDLDALPRLPAWLRPLASFRAADHFGDPAVSIRANVDAYLAGHGIDLGGGRVTMLAHARVLGYVFNPLTVYWCRAADGALACVLAEVHNTYGQRHCYLLRTDERGRAEVMKEFYVSPFYPVDGSYRMSLPEPGDRLALTVALHRPGGPPFVASVRGRRRPATTAGLLAAAARYPWSTVAVTARIHAQGVRLYARGLPVMPRPRQCPQEHQPGDHQAHEHRDHEHQAREHQAREHQADGHRTDDHQADEYQADEHRPQEHRPESHRT
jgi:DUF1365 family protein